jgi:hypothetical protein
MPGWVMMWLLAFGVMAAGKLALLRIHGSVDAAWLWGWPGMDPERFHRRPSQVPDAREANGAWVRIALGGVLLWGVVPRLDGLLAAWTGLVALGLLLHFGIVHLLSIIWRLRGYDAQPLFDHILRSRSVGEFWGRRWNRAFADLAARSVYRPLAPRVGPRPALVAVFLVSGLVHELLLSMPAGAGYGLCTLYFVIQAVGVLVERRRRSRVLTVLFVAVPLPLLFHPAFMQNVLLPFLEVLS